MRREAEEDVRKVVLPAGPETPVVFRRHLANLTMGRLGAPLLVKPEFENAREPPEDRVNNASGVSAAVNCAALRDVTGVISCHTQTWVTERAPSWRGDYRNTLISALTMVRAGGERLTSIQDVHSPALVAKRGVVQHRKHDAILLRVCARVSLVSLFA